ncbi:MAG: hypothetical protein HY549_06480 [Elusimicrobia bacterium]|nr:hypothetical protein [Elusimicrobiota bacterium]
MSRLDRDLSMAAALLVLSLAVLLPEWARGKLVFWSDLAYLHHPWRALETQTLTAGRLPTWNPYVYFGMPLLAVMQEGLFYPGNLLYRLFSFGSATGVYQAFHAWLGGLLTFLWLRSLRLPVLSAALGALGVELGGIFLASRIFLNHLSVLALAPGLLLFFNRPPLLALLLSCAFFAGFPPMLLGSIIAAWAVALAIEGRGSMIKAWSFRWSQAGLLSLALSACLLFPALELAWLSRRAAGIRLEESLRFGFSPRDLWQWLAPWLGSGFDPASRWWTSCHVGLAFSAAAALGFLRLPSRARMAIGFFLTGVALLLLGGSTSISRAAWAFIPGLDFLRYPGNLSHMALPALALLAALGLPKGAWARVWVAAAAIELSIYAWNRFPVSAPEIVHSKGPLAARLQTELGEQRYLLSARALSDPIGLGHDPGSAMADWNHRLYGLANAPLRLRAAANFGEPLVPSLNFHLIDFIYSRPLEQASRFFPWAGIRLLMLPETRPVPAAWTHEGRSLWELYWLNDAVSSGYALSLEDGAALPSEISEDAWLPSARKPIELRRHREDGFSASGHGARPGWAFISEPLYPGWRVWLHTSEGSRETRPEPALTLFQKIPVPAGPWRLDFRYRPWSLRSGVWLTLVALLGLSAYWYNRRRPRGRA